MPASHRPYLIGVSAGPTHWSLLPLAVILKAQPRCDVLIDSPPVLPWLAIEKHAIGQRVRRLQLSSLGRQRVDLAGFLLPYLETALREFPELKVISVHGGSAEVIESEYQRFLDRTYALPTNHWSSDWGMRWHLDPIWNRAYPKFDNLDRNAAIARRYSTSSVHSMQATLNNPITIDVVLPGIHRLLQVWVEIAARINSWWVDAQVPSGGQALKDLYSRLGHAARGMTSKGKTALANAFECGLPRIEKGSSGRLPYLEPSSAPCGRRR